VLIEPRGVPPPRGSGGAMATGLGLFVRERCSGTEWYVEVRPEGTVSDVLRELRVSGALFFGGERVDGVLADCGVCPQSLLELVQSPWELRLLPAAQPYTLVEASQRWGAPRQDVESCCLLRHKGSGAVLLLYTVDGHAEFALSEWGDHVLRNGDMVMRASETGDFDRVCYSQAVPALGVPWAWRGIELQGKLREALCDMSEYSGYFGVQRAQSGLWTIDTTDTAVVISGRYGWGAKPIRMLLEHEGITCVHQSLTWDLSGMSKRVHAWELRGFSLRTLPPEDVLEANAQLGNLGLEGIPFTEGGEEFPILPTRAFDVTHVRSPPCARVQWAEWEDKLLQDYEVEGWEDFDEVFEFELPTKKRTKHCRSLRFESYVSSRGTPNTLKCTLPRFPSQPPPRAVPSARPLPPQATWASPWILRKGVGEAEWPPLAPR